MLITHNTNRAIIVFLVLAASYLTWTALQSSECATTGINLQTRTTWAPVGGCQMVDDYEKPWSVITRE